MGLFSKPKTPTVDVAALTRIAEENAIKQRGIVSGLKGNLTPLTGQYEQKRTALSDRINPETEGLMERYGADLSKVGQTEVDANNQASAAFRERSFRDVPELQRAIRSSLGSTGTAGNAAALSSVARPILDANRTSRDFDANIEQERLRNVTGRAQGFADTGLSARSNAMSTRLGLDEDTINYLTETGRGDLIREAESLLGVEGQLGANKLGIEQARQESEMAKAAASNARRGQLISGLSQLGGAAIGFGLGGPMGAGLGAQLGGTAGQVANGSPVSFDPTLLYAMSQRQPAQRRTAVVNSLGGQVPVRPY